MKENKEKALYPVPLKIKIKKKNPWKKIYKRKIPIKKKKQFVFWGVTNPKHVPVLQLTRQTKF